MIADIRAAYNASFTQERYEAFLSSLNTRLPYPADFRVSETPLFMDSALAAELARAGSELVEQLRTEAFAGYSKKAIPAGLEVPGEDGHTTFLQIDFAVCRDADGNYTPRLIELQGFPSLYAFQVYLAETIQEHFAIPPGFTTFFSGLNRESYTRLLAEAVLAGESPENTILLEIDPWNQKTRIDFAATEAMLGIKAVCITDIKKRGNNLYYENGGREIPVRRIYNRVIYDELQRKQVQYHFRFTDELNVSWAGHPNWFFKISKYTLPFLKSKYVPRCYFLSELEQYPEDLHNFVLKPLFSFAGLGVEVDVTREKLDAVQDRENTILQEKITYAPLIATPDEHSKVEVRMMYIWNDEPRLVNNLIRMSKGKMMGVDFNKNKTWVGSSCAFHPGNV